MNIKLGKYPELKLRDKNDNTVTVKGDKLVEKALKVALSESKIETQIKKLGNTPYEIDNLNEYIELKQEYETKKGEKINE